MSQDAIDRLKRTVLFQSLWEQEEAHHRGDHEISEALKRMVQHVTPLLERIPEHMPEYTLHDRNHSSRIVELMGQILPEETRKYLNIIELSILIYAAYLHDLGMTATREEREQIIRDDREYVKLLRADEIRFNQIEQYRAQGHHRAATFVEDQVFTEYLRRHHVARSQQMIEGMIEDKKLEITWQGTSYARWVLAVCNAHALPVRDLRDVEKWRRNALVRTLRVNVQYLALVLRLADILDLDPERTPASLLDFIDPHDPQSIIEWNKHRAVIGWEITPERIVVEAVCTRPEYERALRAFLQMIETEREESRLLTTSYRDDLAEKYRFDLTEPVEGRIESDGSYISSDMQLSIDFRCVMDLLMGQQFYQDPKLALRELLQNAVDAVCHRTAVEKSEEDVEFKPRIAVRLRGNQLIVEDNGIGMDERIFANYFIQVGRSYYTSPEFRAWQLDIDPVSEFGIGILWVFMVTDRFIVESLARPDAEKPDSPTAIYVECSTAGNYFVRRSSRRNRVGTKITLDLKAGHPFTSENLLATVQELAPFFPYPVTVERNGQEKTYQLDKPGNYWWKPDHVKNQPEGFFEVSFGEGDDPVLSGICGLLKVIPGPRYARQLGGVLTQRGFAIARLWESGVSSDISQQLPLPEWASLWLSLDLRDEARLTLSPDRTRVRKDERWQRLKEVIEQRLIYAFRQHFEQKQAEPAQEYRIYVHNLLNQNGLRISFYDLPEKMLDLLRDLVPLPCLGANGEIVYRMARDLYTEPLLLVANQDDWHFISEPLAVCRAVTHGLGEFPTVLLLLQGEDGEATNSVINRLFRSNGMINGMISCSEPGLVLDLLQDHTGSFIKHPAGIFEVKVETDENTDYHVDLTYNLSEPSNQHTLLCIQSNVFHAGHPLLTPLLKDDQAHDDRCKWLLVDFAEAFSEIINRLEDNPDFGVGQDANGKRIKLPKAMNVRMVGIFQRVPELLEEFRTAARVHWQRMQNLGRVPADAACPELTERDFPWFWSRERWE